MGVAKLAKVDGGLYKGKPASPDTVKKTVDFQGLKIKIDRPKGFITRGTAPDGSPYETKYLYDYGYIKGTQGGDGDGIDVFIGPDKQVDEVFWARKLHADGSFDEYKVFLGFSNREAAIAAFRQHIPKRMLGGVVTMRLPMMKAMLGLMPSEKIASAYFFGLLQELERLQ